MSSDSEALNGLAKLEWQIVTLGLNEAITEVGRLNLASGDLTGSFDKVEAKLLEVSEAAQKLAAAEAEAGDATEELAAKNDVAASSFGKVSTTLSGQRHALAAASGDLAALGAGLLAIPIASALIASDYQRDFANVERATLLPVGAADRLKQSLIDLSEQVPDTFKDITQIATAGAQLGIPTSGLVQFTTVVAKLTATTQVSAVAAENLFQKFYVLAGVQPDNFNNLASAILNVSIHTGAAEAQVSLLATRIIGVAQQAGFTVPQVIALSAAFGSISAQSASYQMGTVIRLVGTLQTAVEGAGPALDAFANTAHLTDQQVQSAFGTPKFASYFLDFISGLDQVKKSGGDTLAILDAMGINSIRDRAAIDNLADAHVTLAKALKLATDGYDNASLINLHFQQVNETLKSQTTEMISTFGALGNQIGEVSTGPLTNLVDGVIAATKAFSGFEQTPFGQGATVFAVSAAAILGSLVLITSAGLKVGSSIIALRDAFSIPAKYITNAYAEMAASATAAATAAEDDEAWNLKSAATLEALGYEADAAAASFTELAAAEDAAATSNISTLGKLGALFGGTTAGGLASVFAPIAAGGVAFVAAADFAQQLAETNAQQQGLTVSAQKFSDQLKSNAVSTQQYVNILQGLSSDNYGRQDTKSPITYNAALVDTSNLDSSLSTAPATQLIAEYAKLVDAANQVGVTQDQMANGIKNGQELIAEEFPKATAAYKDAIAANLGLATAAQQAAEGIRNTATATLQLDDDFGGAANVTKLEASITKSVSSLSGMKTALDDLTSPAKVVTESLGDVTKQLQANTATATTWSDNLKTVTLEYGNDVANQFISAGADATTESLLAQLVAATPAQGAKYKSALLANLNATSAAVAQQQLAAADIVNANGSAIGKTEAEAISAELADGVDFRTIAQSWGIQLDANPLKVTVAIGGDTTGAAAAANAFFKQFSNSAATANHWVGNSIVTPAFTAISPTHTFSSGGPTMRSSSDHDVAGVVHANEFVFSAAATRNIGVENLAFAHNMAKHGRGFYDGGFTGGGPAAMSGMGVVSLSPTDRKILLDGFAQQMYAVLASSDVELALHANAGNKQLGPRGRN